MSHDEQRKRIYELECALGTAIKICEQQKESMANLIAVNGKLSDIISTLSVGVQTYMNTMDKKHLLNAVGTIHEYSKTLRHK